MKVTCIQMDMVLSAPEENFQKAEKLIMEAAQTLSLIHI